MNAALFLLFPFIICAQTNYTDTLFVKGRGAYPCLITEMNESSVKIIYAENKAESAVIESIDKIVLNEHGIIFNSVEGFLINPESIQPFLKQKHDLYMSIQKEADMSREKEESEKRNIEVGVTNIVQVETNKNRWSFGALYIPYSSAKIYSFIRSNSEPQVFSIINSETNMEAQVAYRVGEKVSLTFDVGFSAASTENRMEQHSRTTDTYSSAYDYGYKEIKDLSLLRINVGIKYYIKNILNENVSAFLLAGIGKQFAFSSSSYETLFGQPDPGAIIEDNENEYVEDLNSPLFLNFGFGAEYYFNESLSLFSNIRFIYSHTDAAYDYRRISPIQTQTETNEYSSSDFSTRVGLGINFYF